MYYSQTSAGRTPFFCHFSVIFTQKWVWRPQRLALWSSPVIFPEVGFSCSIRVMLSGGIIGITLKEAALKVWAISRHSCCKSEVALNEMEEGENASYASHLSHKEEGISYRGRCQRQRWNSSNVGCMHRPTGSYATPRLISKHLDCKCA